MSSVLEAKNQNEVSVETISFHIPDDLSDFLKQTGGASGPIGDENYIDLYSCLQILEYNRAYAVSEFLPGYLLIGTVNDDALVIDQKSNYYVVPFIPMSEQACVKVAEGVEDLLDYLTSHSMFE